MKIRKSICKHCNQPIHFAKDKVWVHTDVDEDINQFDSGWVKCLPNEDETFEYAEPRKWLEKGREFERAKN